MSQTEIPDEPITIDSESHLQEVLDQHGVVLVDFYADWCGPCQMLEPILEELAADTDAVVAKVDVDEHQGLAAANAVQGVPTMLLYADGQQAGRHVGAKPAEQLRSEIDSLA